jgi:hypothetical protein
VFDRVMALEEATSPVPPRIEISSPSISIVNVVSPNSPHSPTSPLSEISLLDQMPGNPLMMGGVMMTSGDLELVEDASSSSSNSSVENSPKSFSVASVFTPNDYLEVLFCFVLFFVFCFFLCRFLVRDRKMR